MYLCPCVQLDNLWAIQDICANSTNFPNNGSLYEFSCQLVLDSYCPSAPVNQSYLLGDGSMGILLNENQPDETRQIQGATIILDACTAIVDSTFPTKPCGTDFDCDTPLQNCACPNLNFTNSNQLTINTLCSSITDVGINTICFAIRGVGNGCEANIIQNGAISLPDQPIAYTYKLFTLEQTLQQLARPPPPPLINLINYTIFSLINLFNLIIFLKNTVRIKIYAW